MKPTPEQLVQNLLEDQEKSQKMLGFSFPIVRRVFPQRLIAQEIVSIQPMSAPTGALFYFDMQDRNSMRIKLAGLKTKRLL